jgi:hypothetical protein
LSRGTLCIAFLHDYLSSAIVQRRCGKILTA